MQNTYTDSPSSAASAASPSKVHFIGGEKGGVGKSMVARLLAQYFIDHHIAFTGFDTDRSHGALRRFYTDYSSPVLVSRYEALDQIIETAAARPGQRVLVDLAAQTHEPLATWMEDSGVLDLADEAGLSLCHWHVMDSGRDSVDLLARALDRFGPRVQHVLVLNQLRGDDFGILSASGLLTRAAEMGAKVITLKRLHEAVVQKIDASSSSFWAAKHGTGAEGSGLGLMERQRLKTWLGHAFSEIAQAKP
jgi:hypothetical protein